MAKPSQGLTAPGSALAPTRLAPTSGHTARTIPPCESRFAARNATVSPLSYAACLRRSIACVLAHTKSGCDRAAL